LNLRVIAELEPTRNREKLLKRVKLLAPHVDAIDIPEVPMGRPIASAPVVAAHLSALYPGTSFIPHIRVIDVNRVGMLSILGGLAAAGVGEAVLLRGDRPVEGRVVEDLTVEEAARLAVERLRRRPSLGAMLSIRYPLPEIERRLEAPFSFYLVLRAFTSLEKLREVSRAAHRLGKKLYAYLIVGGSNYEQLRRMLGDQPVYRPQEAVEAAAALEGVVDGVLVSSPGSLETVVETVQKLYRR